MRMVVRLIHIITRHLYAFLFPERCLGCKKPNELLCDMCAYAYAAPERIRLPSNILVLSVFRYSTPAARYAVRTVKYRRGKRLAERLGDILAKHIVDIKTLFAGEHPICIPIPVSSKTLRKRGYNHAEIFAQKIADTHSWEMNTRALKKIKHTPSQTLFRTRRERKKNIKESFEIVSDAGIAGRTILLVDDVLTSGATLEEAGRVLKQAGAKKIFGVVIARG